MNNRSNAHLCWRTSGPVRPQTYAIEIEYNIAITVISASIYYDIFVEEALLLYVLRQKAVFVVTKGCLAIVIWPTITKGVCNQMRMLEKRMCLKQIYSQSTDEAEIFKLANNKLTKLTY